VRLSAKTYIPKVVPLLEKCVVISARSSYEKLFPNEPIAWKYHAFQSVITKDTERVISLGDSLVEREAARSVCSVKNKLLKSVKFTPLPSIEILQKQQELVIKCFEDIYNNDKALDLMLTIHMLN
jgi:hypothetical protein